MKISRMTARFAAALALAVVAGACNDDDDPISPPNNNPNRSFTQIERLGNPLTSEVFYMKRDHGLHNTTGPATDDATGNDEKIKAFVASFGRSATIQNTLAAVLTPDMLLVFPNRAGNTAGWLSWALAAGYGGRKLQDDVVDAGLSAVFGTLVDPAAGTVAGLTSDNVPASVRSFGTAFPYLEPAR